MLERALRSRLSLSVARVRTCVNAQASVRT